MANTPGSQDADITSNRPRSYWWYIRKILRPERSSAHVTDLRRARYLGKYIKYDDSKSDWLRDRTLTWEKNINTTSKTAEKYPQKSYTVVVCTIQSEWIFLQCVTWDRGDTFAGVEKIIWGWGIASSFPQKDQNSLTHHRNSK